MIAFLRRGESLYYARESALFLPTGEHRAEGKSRGGRVGEGRRREEGREER